MNTNCFSEFFKLCLLNKLNYQYKGSFMREKVMEFTVKAYTFVLPFYEYALAIVLLLIPLAIWRKTRGIAGVGLVITSYIFGLTTWLLGAAITFGSFGWLGLIIGLFIFGVGVVPLAIIGAFFKLEDGGLALVLLVMMVVALSARFGGFYAASKAEATSR